MTPKQRRRAFAPKSRSGCDVCKQRRVKCDEARPSCENCQKRGVNCNYTAPKVWIFEPSKQSDGGDTVLIKRPSMPDLAGLTPYSWPAEERNSMRYFMRRTGKWLSHYCDPDARDPWCITLPRMAMNLPALRHLVVATAMMDEKLHKPTTQALVVRSERIIFHYNEAIHLLTTHAAPMIEVLVCAVIAHTLETMIRNTTAARIHLEAAGKLLAKGIETTKINDGSETARLISNDVRAMYLSAAGYHSTEPAFRLAQDTSAVSVLDSLKALHSPQGLRSTEEVLFVFEQLFDRLNSGDQPGRPSVNQLRDFMTMWELAILQLSHDSPEPPVNMIAAHMLICVANALVPQICYGSLDEEQFILRSPMNAKATGYIIRKLFVLMEEDIGHLGQFDLAIFNKILKLAFRAIRHFARHESHRNEANTLLQKVEISGVAAERSKSPNLEIGRASSFAEPEVKFATVRLEGQPLALSSFARRKLEIICPPADMVVIRHGLNS